MWLMSFITKVASIIRTAWKEPSNRDQRLRRLLISFGWQIYKRIIRLPVIIRLDNGAEFILEPKSGNSAGAIYTRIYESKYVLFARKNVLPGGMMIDVGAHSGLYTLLLAPLFEHGFCFEPAADTFNLLVRNLGLNQLKKFAARREAVSSVSGEFGFALGNSPYSGAAHLLCDGEAPSGEKVQVITLDFLLHEVEITDLTYLKIDTEGHELDVLKGGNRVLQLNPHALVQFENSCSREQIYEFFMKLGWRPFGLTNSGVPTVSRSTMETEYNLLACGPHHKLFDSVPEISTKSIGEGSTE